MNIYGSGFSYVVNAPYHFKKLIACKHPSGVFHKSMEQLMFFSVSTEPVRCLQVQYMFPKFNSKLPIF